MDLEKIILHQSHITKQTDDVTEHRKATLELVTAVGDLYDIYTRHGAQKQLLSLQAAKVINGYIKIAVMRGWGDHLYMWEEAVLESEEIGLSGGFEGALLESLMFLNVAASFKTKGPFAEAAKLLNLSHEEYCFSQSWYVAYIALRIGIGYDLGEYEGTELESLYFEYHAVRPHMTLIAEDA